MKVSLRSAWVRHAGTTLVLGAALMIFWDFTLNPDAQERSYPVRVSNGEALLHGVSHPDVSYSMPLSGIVEALHENHMPAPLRDAFPKIMLTFCLLPVYLLGRLLHSHACGLLSLVGCVALRLIDFGDGQEETLYYVLFQLTACLLCWRAGKPTRTRSAVLGLGIGLALLVRSPLFFFPVLLCGYEVLAAKGPAHKRRLLDLAPVILLPAFMLTPWVLMNASVHESLILFERLRGDSLIMTGAAGLTTDFEMTGQTLREFAGAPDDGLVLWAVGEVLRHPLRSAFAWFQRLLYGLSSHPGLAALAALAIYRNRKREPCRQLALLCGYLMGLHCLMGIDTSYFEPIWLVLTVLTAAPFADLLGMRPDSRQWPHAAKVFRYALFPFGLLAAGSLALVALYPFRAQAPLPDVDRALRMHPHDPWLLSRRGNLRLLAGDREGGIRDFTSALMLSPTKNRELDLAWARLVQGGAGADLADRIILDEKHSVHRGLLLRAVSAALQGNGSGSYSAAKKALRHEQEAAFRQETGHGGMRASSPGSLDRDVGGMVLGILNAWPLAQRLEIALRLAPPSAKDLFLPQRMAETAVAAGSLRAAAQYIERAGGGSLRKAWTRLSPNVRPPETMLAELLEGEVPGVPTEIWIRLAEASTTPDRGLSVQALQRAGSQDPTDEQRIRISDLFNRLGQPMRALKTFRPLVDRGGAGDPWTYITAAKAARKAGDRTLALRSLSQAAGRKPTGDAARELILEFAEIHAHEPALAYLDSPELRLTYALAEYRAGHGLIARTALEKIEPKDLDYASRLSLFHLYQSMGEPSRALGVFDTFSGAQDRDPALLLDASAAARDAGQPLYALRLLERVSGAQPAQELEVVRRFKELGAHDRALARLRALGERAPESLDAQAWFDLALLLQGSREYPGALKIFDTLIAASPGSARLRANRGVVRALASDEAGAMADLRKAIALDPQSPAPYLTLGGMLVTADRRDEAVALYDRALKTEKPGSGLPIYGLIRESRSAALADADYRSPR